MPGGSKIELVRCHKILGTPMKMGTRGPHSPGRMGTPLGKWGSLLSDFSECPIKPHLDLSHRYLSTKVNKVEQFSSCLSVQIQNGKRCSVRTRMQMKCEDTLNDALKMKSLHLFPPQRCLFRNVGGSMTLCSFMFTVYVDSLKGMTLR